MIVDVCLEVTFKHLEIPPDVLLKT